MKLCSPIECSGYDLNGHIKAVGGEVTTASEVDRLLCRPGHSGLEEANFVHLPIA